MKVWEKFKIEIGIECFNAGIKIKDYNIPDNLRFVLEDANGQNPDCKPVFREFKNDILGVDIYLYKFLSYSDILILKEEMQLYTDDKTFYPFAILANRQIDDKGGIVFAICISDMKIYKVYFSSWDRFGKNVEYRKELFANNFVEFIENQILWYSIR